MGCTMATAQVDGDELPANSTPSRPGLFRRQAPSSPHQESIEKRALRTGLLSKKCEEHEFSPGSPSFRCYVRTDMKTDGNNIVTSICEQGKENAGRLNNSSKRENSSRQDEASRSPQLNQEKKGKSQKKEKGWMSKVLFKRAGDTAGAAPSRQSNN